MNKNFATGEYKKYQQKMLSDVEEAYLESIKGLEKKVASLSKSPSRSWR